MKNMTPQELINYIKGTAKKGARPATVTLSTIPKMRKFHRTEKGKDDKKIENPFYGDIIKVATHKVMINFIFENAVNNQKKREGKKADFEVSERSWGTHVTHSLIEHNGGYYLQCKREKTLETAFLHKGKLIEKSQLDEYLVESSSSSNQDLEKKVIPFSPKFQSIDSINIDGLQIEQK